MVKHPEEFTFTSLDGVRVTVNKEDAERMFHEHLVKIAKLNAHVSVMEQIGILQVGEILLDDATIATLQARAKKFCLECGQKLPT
jgi:hypothetical protein